MTQAANYSATGRDLLDKALALLEQGDLIQASEKGWGAAAQAVKSVAESRGWAHNGHRQLFDVVARLTRETADDRLRVLFSVANGLHANFYENWLQPDEVSKGLADVKAFVELLEPLRS
jgi:hypothetical protein